MKRFALLVPVLLGVGLLALPHPACGLQFGIIVGGNVNYASGVMGGASSAGSGIPRQATANDNVVIYRESTPPPPVFRTALTAQVFPECGAVIYPAILLIGCPLPPDPGLIHFAPAGTVVQNGADQPNPGAETRSPDHAGGLRSRVTVFRRGQETCLLLRTSPVGASPEFSDP